MYRKRTKVVMAMCLIALFFLWNYDFASASYSSSCTDKNGFTTWWDPNDFIPLQNGVSVKDIWINMDDSRSFSFVTPHNVSQLDIKAWGGEGRAIMELSCAGKDETHWADNWSGPLKIKLLYPECSCWFLVLYATDTITEWTVKATYKTSGTDTNDDPDTTDPDLTGQWLSLNHKCVNTSKGPKCRIKGKVTVQNLGNEDAEPSEVNFYLSEDDNYDTGDILLKEVAVGKIKVGKTKSRTLKYKLPLGQTATDKYIIAVMDADGSNSESNEANNNVAYGPIP